MDTMQLPSDVDVFDGFRLGLSTVNQTGRAVGFTSYAHEPSIDCEVFPFDSDATIALLQRDIRYRAGTAFSHSHRGMQLMQSHHQWRERADEKTEALLAYPDTTDLSDEQLFCSFFNTVFRIYGPLAIDTPYVRTMLERLIPLKCHSEQMMIGSLTRYGTSHNYRVAGVIRSLRFRRALPQWWSDFYPLWPHGRSRRS